MKTRNKIFLVILAILAVILGILAFFIFFYPDEQLKDLSDLTPTIQNVAKENNAYFLVEAAKSVYKESKFIPQDLISFLMGKTTTATNPNTYEKETMTIEDVTQFLSLEEASINLLEQAEQLPSYQDPRVDSYTTMNAVTMLAPKNLLIVRALFVKGTNEFKEGKTNEGVQTVVKAMELAAKMRKGSLTVMEYIVNNSIIMQGKEIIIYFANNGAVIPAEIQSRINELKDSNWDEFVNPLKFNFYVDLNEFYNVYNARNIFTENNFNFRKNVTINVLADEIRARIKEAKNYDCTVKSPESTLSRDAEWTYLFKENGIGQTFIAAVSFETGTFHSTFCSNSLLEPLRLPVIDNLTQEKIKRDVGTQATIAE